MSIWTSKALAAAGAFLALSACLPGDLSGSGRHVSRNRVVMDGAVTVAGPAGYCVDQQASRDYPGGAFVIFGSCAALAGSRAAGQPDRTAVLTATVATGPTTGPVDKRFAELTRFFQSAPGRTALSRSGKAESVRILRAHSENRVLYLSLSDSAGAKDGLDPRYWRAVFSLRDNMVTLTVKSHISQPVSAEEMKAILDVFIRTMRGANTSAA